MGDSDLVKELRGVMHAAEPALTDDELATLSKTRNRLEEIESEDAREATSDVTVTLHPRVNFGQLAADLRTLADEIERDVADEMVGGDPQPDGGTISEATLEERKQATSGPTMERVTFRLPRHLREAVDAAVEAGQYPNRSEALREAVRETFVATDGGAVDHDRPDPGEDPTLCSKCGVHIGAFGGEYCDPCEREIGAKPPIRRCVHCGQRAPQDQMEAIDVSTDDEYYPEFEYLCRGCAGGED